MNFILPGAFPRILAILGILKQKHIHGVNNYTQKSYLRRSVVTYAEVIREVEFWCSGLFNEGLSNLVVILDDGEPVKIRRKSISRTWEQRKIPLRQRRNRLRHPDRSERDGRPSWWRDSGQRRLRGGGITAIQRRRTLLVDGLNKLATVNKGRRTYFYRSVILLTSSVRLQPNP